MTGRRYVLCGLVLWMFTLSGCVWLVRTVRSGCTDVGALNYDAQADVDDGACRFSTVAFYASANAYNLIPIRSIRVWVDGIALGRLEGVYPSGLRRCAAPGTIAHEFQRAGTVDWDAIVTLASNARLVTSGMVGSSSGARCITVDVTSN